MTKALIYSISLCLVGYVCFIFGARVPFKEQWALYESLRTTASIIFGVMGAWIAIIYPTVLTKIFDKKYAHKKEELKKISRLLSPLLISTLIVVTILIIGIVTPIFKQIMFFQQHVEISRGLSFCMLGILTMTQIWTLLASLAPGENLLFELTKEEDKSQVVKRLKSNIKR